MKIRLSALEPSEHARFSVGGETYRFDTIGRSGGGRVACLDSKGNHILLSGRCEVTLLADTVENTESVSLIDRGLQIATDKLSEKLTQEGRDEILKASNTEADDDPETDFLGSQRDLSDLDSLKRGLDISDDNTEHDDNPLNLDEI